jgi:cholesterol transport system auxiliary component
MNSKVMTLCSFMILSMLLTGCRYDRRNFVLEVSRDRPRLEVSKDVVLDVQSFNVDTAFSNRSLVYRKNQSEYEQDFYNQFLIRPEDMVTEKTRSWLSESGLFELVLEPSSHIDASHVLEGNIIALYGDFRDKSSPKATIKIRFFLIKLSDKSVVFAKTYETTSESNERTAKSLVEAFDNCLANILSDLEEDLQEQL